MYPILSLCPFHCTIPISERLVLRYFTFMLQKRKKKLRLLTRQEYKTAAEPAHTMQTLADRTEFLKVYYDLFSISSLFQVPLTTRDCNFQQSCLSLHHFHLFLEGRVWSLKFLWCFTHRVAGDEIQGHKEDLVIIHSGILERRLSKRCFYVAYQYYCLA